MNWKLVAILGATVVAFGAFGAHGLKPKLEIASYQSYQTAVQYHFFHTLAILALMRFSAEKVARLSSKLFAIGIVLFSGSIYLLSTKSVTGLSVGFLGPITPLGGVLFIAGWLNLLRMKPNAVSNK